MAGLRSSVGRLRKRVVVVALAAAIAGLGAMASSASALAPVSTWSGASTSSSNWTVSGNWDTAPSSGNALDFPSLSTCASPAACYSSNNNETSGFSVAGLTFDDGVPYDVFGNSITLGASGLTASPTTQTAGNHVQISLPIALGANQTWTIDGGTTGGGQGIDYTGQLSGSSSTLGVTLSHNGTLISEGQNQEVGDVTISGTDGTQTGLNAPNNGTVSLTSGGDLNGTDGHTVTLNNAALAQGDNVTIGQLSSTGGELQIGNGIAPPGVLTVNGTVTLDSNTATLFSIGGGTAPGTDYGQLNAGANNVTLAGALQLMISHHGGPCPTLNVGDVDTLVATTGTISGTFAGVSDGAFVSTAGSGVCGQTKFQIHYSSTAVTATVVDNTPHSTSKPTISGNLWVGQTLTEGHATWSSNGGSAPSSYIYRWDRCDASGNNCFPVGGNSPTYTLQPGDQGHTFDVFERASNNEGEAAQGVTSSPTGVVQAGAPTPPAPSATPPVNQTAPLASGSNVVGGTVSTTNGVWGGSSPMSFAIVWQRCGVTCSNIPGAAGSSYKLTSADINKRVRAVVAASNSAGGMFAVSNQVGPVKAAPFEIRGWLLAESVPKGKADSIRAILKAGGAVLRVTAIEPGSELIGWYFAPRGAHSARGHHPKAVLVATGRISFSAPGSANLKLKLTKSGRRMLQHARRMRLTARAAFTPTGQSGTSVKKQFMLKR